MASIHPHSKTDQFDITKLNMSIIVIESGFSAQKNQNVIFIGLLPVAYFVEGGHFLS